MSTAPQIAGGSLPFEHWRATLDTAAKEVFTMMVGAEIKALEPESSLLQSEITGMVGLAGGMCGILSVRCSANSATQIASAMLGIPLAEAGAHQSDAIGEICNMVAGNFKAKIDGMQDKCMLSVPTVITGEDYQMHSIAVGDGIELFFVYEGEPILIELEVRS